MGEIGIDHHTALYELKQWQIIAIINGYRKREHGAWRMTRWQTWLILCAMGDKDHARPEDLCELPGDGEQAEQEEISEEEYNETLELIRQANMQNK